jgi:peptide methionine sulfoxide reductase MsrA
MGEVVLQPDTSPLDFMLVCESYTLQLLSSSSLLTIFAKQMEIAKKVTSELQQLIDKGKIGNYQNKQVTTAVTPAFEFYKAEDYHQEYLAKNPFGYCNHGYRFTQWPSLV